MRLYRFVCDDLGIYEAVEKYCPKDDKRRAYKPDGSWLPKVGESFSGAVSFWTEAGLQRYNSSGLKDWHCSVVSDSTKMIIAEISGESLYSDEFQVISKIDQVETVKEYPFKYEGPVPPIKVVNDFRPNFVRHHSYGRDWNAYAPYEGNKESFTVISSIGKDLGLVRIGIHHEFLKPGKRSSWPHAHKVEEELVYILAGEGSVWINGDTYPIRSGDLVYFEPATNEAHTILNDSSHDLEMIVMGEQNAEGDMIHYPLHPGRNKECEDSGYYWQDHPVTNLGYHRGEPGSLKTVETRYKKSINFIDAQEKVSGSSHDEYGIYIKDRDLGRELGAKRLAVHHVTVMPGHKTSIPHAESNEEEFIYVLNGQLKAWINGELIPIEKGDSVAFPSGKGIVHSFLNDSSEEVELLVIGETTKDDNKFIYPLNLELKEENIDYWWNDWPVQELLKK